MMYNRQGTLPFTDGKNHQNHCIPPFGYLPGPAGAQGWQIPDIFPEKPGRFSPFRNPLYFQAINAFFSPFDALYDQLHFPFFAMKITRLNWPVFSRLKRSVSKNTDFYRKSCVGTISTGAFQPSDPAGNSPSENGSWERACPAPPPFIKGSPARRWRATYRACGFV